MNFFVKRSFIFLLIVFSNTILADVETSKEKIYNVAILENDLIAEHHFKMIEQELGYKFNYQKFDEFDDVVESVRQKNSDLAANITYTSERATYFNLTSPTNIVPVYFYSDDKALDDSHVVGIPRNTIFVTIAERVFPDLTIIEYGTIDEAINLIKTKQVDGVIDAIFALEEYVDYGFRTEFINSSFPVPPASLAASFDIDKKIVDEMALLLQDREIQAEFRDKIYMHQFSIRKQAIQEEAEKFDLDLSQPLKIKLEDRPPMVNYSDGEITGIAPDILKEICAMLEANCQIVGYADESWDKKYNELKNNQIDILGAISISEDRKEEVYFSEPFYTATRVVVKRYDYQNDTYSDLSELIMERIGVIKGEFYQSVIENALPNKELIEYSNLEDKVNGLINDEVDYILLNEIDYNLLVKESNGTLPIQIDDFFTFSNAVGNGFAFPKTEKGQLLAHLFDLSLDTINIKPIIAKYDVSPNWLSILKTQRKNEIIGYVFFTCLIIMILIFVFFQYRRSITDELTQLKNRRALYKKNQTLKKNHSLIYLDLNSFKILNDTNGHLFGDQVLVAFSNQIKKYWEGDAYRIGGDEFILIGKNSEAQKRSLEKITKFDMNVNGKLINLTASMGKVQYDIDGVELDLALHDADIEMYEDKKRKYKQKELENKRNKAE